MSSKKNTMNLLSRLKVNVLTMTVFMAINSCQKKIETPIQKVDPVKASQTPSLSDVEKAKAKVDLAPNYENWIDLGLAYQNENKSLKAKESYLKALEIKQNDPIVYNNLCWLYYQQNLLKDAESNCKKALQISPKFVLALNNLKETESKKLELINQRKALETELKKTNHKEQTWLDIGMIEYQLQNFEQANSYWKKIPKNAALYPFALSNQASVDILTLQYAEAEKKLNEAILLLPDEALFKRNKNWLEEARKSSL